MLTTLMLLACVEPTEPAAANAGPHGPGDLGDAADTAANVEDSGAVGDDPEADRLAEWTLLVFVNGDNDLERYALADINEMETVGSTDAVNVVVQVDRSERQSEADGDWSGARRYRVEQDGDTRTIGSPILEDLGEIDSGNAQTVVDFVAWGVERWPAKRYAVILWDHGDGWSLAGEREAASTKGISYDDGAGTGISVAAGDLTELVDGAVAVMQQPVDLFGFDACTMAQWEVAWSVGAGAGVMVASEDYEDVAGWPYDDVLTDLVADPTMDAAALGGQIALRFHEIPDSTLSVIDLAALPALTARLDELADGVLAGGLVGETLQAATVGAQGYDGQFSREHDLVDLLERLEAASVAPDVKLAAAAAREAALAAVPTSYNRGGAVKNSHGLSIFSPTNASMPPLYARAAWSAETRWDDLMSAAVEASKE